MRVLRSRVFIAILCFAIAAAIAFVLLPITQKNKESTVEIVRAVKDIPMGTQITEEYLSVVEVGAYRLPGETVYEKDAVIGQYAAIDIVKDSALLQAMFHETKETTKVEQALADGMKLVTISLSSIAAGGGGHIQSGDTVTVLVYKEVETETEEGIVTSNQVLENPDFENLLVYSLEDVQGRNLTDSTEEGQAPKSITLLVTEAQAVMLVDAEYSGNLHLVFQKD